MRPSITLVEAGQSGGASPIKCSRARWCAGFSRVRHNRVIQEEEEGLYMQYMHIIVEERDFKVFRAKNIS